MHGTVLRLAENVSKTPLNLRQASATLLPPLPLYRSILRAHRNLPAEFRSLGDVYVKSEFHRHKEVTNPAHIIGFLSQWKKYLEQMPDKEGGSFFRGKRIDPTLFEKMSEEQLGQLHEFMQSTKDIWKSPSGGS